ncbi:hypothetical protein [Deinococcus cellulosilyticus]|uniref:Uncharacterized protein n=1 Tax=Deinococcus cellulosilyticus (strain DSM 18568 / NBRC 106333 / KACC 11606 / 5516J-15) TaxID=1223518 RepID=A0A511N7S3_DEIC1|nr:hypothetical protein [Deinococcus cellulosilyticus]GEM48892.1 hypothetical protein DC3_45270 [Deinococcus cellulosilyticus NBRC 106333 = KACC 11606]
MVTLLLLLLSALAIYAFYLGFKALDQNNSRPAPMRATVPIKRNRR